MNRYFLSAVAAICFSLGVTATSKTLDAAATSAENKNAKVAAFIGIVEWEYKPLAWDCDAPHCDHFALYDTTDKTNYDLDDARKAAPFEGKKVKVTGILDVKQSTIHVESIESIK